MSKKKAKRAPLPQLETSSETITEASEVDPDVAYVPYFHVEEPKSDSEPEPKPEPKLTPKAPNPNAVALRVYLTAGGMKLDQMAGFQNYAIRKNLTPRTMKEWRAAYEAFMNMPIS